jgi:hypothetical protein
MNKKIRSLFFPISLITFTLTTVAQPLKNADLISNEASSKNSKEIFKTTLSYFLESERYADAKALAERELKKNPKDQEVLRLNGLVLYLMRDFSGAREKFKLASKFSDADEKAINLYLVTQSEIKLKNYEAAVDSLKEMGENPSSREYAKRALTELKSNRSIPEFNPKLNDGPVNTSSTSSNKISGKGAVQALNLGLAFGLDTNPVFIPDYSQTKNDAHSTFFSVNPNLSISNGTRFGVLNNGLSLGYTSYTKDIAKNFNNFRASLNTELIPKSDFFKDNNLSISNNLSQSYQTDPEFQYYFTQDNLVLRKDIKSSGPNSFATAFNLGFRTYANKTIIDPADDRSGFSYAAKAIHKYSGKDWNWLNSISGNYQDTFGGKFNTLTTDYSGNFQKMLPRDLELTLGLGISHIDYVNSVDGRSDVMTSVGGDLGGSSNWVEGMNYRFSYARVTNNSKLKDSTYTQNIFSIWISYDL